MREAIVAKLLDIVEKYWFRRSTIVIIILLILLVAPEFLSNFKFEELSLQGVGLTFFAILVIFAFWYNSVRLPKVPADRIGFAVAIVPETKEVQQKIDTDFIVALRDLIHGSEMRSSFSFLVIPQHLARTIQSGEQAVKILYDSRCRFLVFGRARTRRIQGKDVELLNLEGAVSHGPLPTEVQRKLSAEFSELFPRRLLVEAEGDVFSLELTANLINLVSRYVMGIALLLSGDFAYAQRLVEQVQRDVVRFHNDFPAIVKIRQRIPKLLADVYLVQVRLAYANWRRTKDPQFMEEMDPHLGHLEHVDPDNVDLHACRAIWLFVTKRDVAGALEEIRKARNTVDQTWRYNHAFLLAYKGSLKTALEEYKRASKKVLPNPRTLLDVEEFITWVVDKEPDKTQLHFALGLINFFSKGDQRRAMLDFEKFLEVTPANNFPEQRRLAEAYLQTIRGNLELSQTG